MTSLGGEHPASTTTCTSTCTRTTNYDEAMNEVLSLLTINDQKKLHKHINILIMFFITTDTH